MSLTYNANIFYDLKSVDVKGRLLALFSYQDLDKREIEEGPGDEVE